MLSRRSRVSMWSQLGNMLTPLLRREHGTRYTSVMGAIATLKRANLVGNCCSLADAFYSTASVL